jgi:hypothetical protein
MVAGIKCCLREKSKKVVYFLAVLKPLLQGYFECMALQAAAAAAAEATEARS